jgi:hypothetical protein
MADNIKAVALAANLQGQSKKQVDDLVKSLFVHRELSNLPKDVAVAKYAQLPPDQQQTLLKSMGQKIPLLNLLVDGLELLGTMPQVTTQLHLHSRALLKHRMQ